MNLLEKILKNILPNEIIKKIAINFKKCIFCKINIIGNTNCCHKCYNKWDNFIYPLSENIYGS